MKPVMPGVVIIDTDGKGYIALMDDRDLHLHMCVVEVKTGRVTHQSYIPEPYDCLTPNSMGELYREEDDS